MKKILLLVALLTGVSQLKAQNLYQIKPMDTISIKKYFNKPVDSLTKRWSPLLKSNGFGTLQPTDLAMLRVSHSPIDHMPIVRMQGNSKMPVVRLQGNSKMPVIDPLSKGGLDLQKPGATVPDSK